MQGFKKQLAAHPLLIAFFFFVLIGSSEFTRSEIVLGRHACMPRWGASAVGCQ